MSVKRQPFFSIVISTYNRADLVCATLESVLAQTFTAWEAIIIDDASTDNTLERLKTYTDQRIRVLTSPQNRGASAAMNRGTAEAKGNYVAFLDSDDTWLPSRLQVAFDEISGAGPAATQTLFYSRLIFDRGNNITQIKPARAKQPSERVLDYILCDEGLIQTSTIILPTPAARNLPYDEALPYHTDYSLVADAEAAGLAFHMIEQPLVVWNNELRPGRKSSNNPYNHAEAWIAAKGKHLTPRARRAYLATHVAPRRRNTAPLRGLIDIIRAFLVGAIRPRRFLLSLVSYLLPRDSYAQINRQLVHMKAWLT